MKRIVGVLALTMILLGLADSGLGGSINGPRRWKKVVKANSVIEYRIEFLAPKNPLNPLRREAAEFALIGDGSTDIDIRVLDDKGQPVLDDKGQPVQDIYDTDIARIVWFPKKTGTYIIQVRNLGNADNECLMAHN